MRGLIDFLESAEFHCGPSLVHSSTSSSSIIARDITSCNNRWTQCCIVLPVCRISTSLLSVCTITASLCTKRLHMLIWPGLSDWHLSTRFWISVNQSIILVQAKWLLPDTPLVKDWTRCPRPATWRFHSRRPLLLDQSLGLGLPCLCIDILVQSHPSMSHVTRTRPAVVLDTCRQDSKPLLNGTD